MTDHTETTQKKRGSNKTEQFPSWYCTEPRNNGRTGEEKTATKIRAAQELAKMGCGKEMSVPSYDKGYGHFGNSVALFRVTPSALFHHTELLYVFLGQCHV